MTINSFFYRGERLSYRELSDGLNILKITVVSIVKWFEKEDWTDSIKRKEHPRLLSFLTNINEKL